MLPTAAQTSNLIPSWIFEQDYLVFLSFFGWMLVGLLAWTKPLSEKEDSQLPWLWFGYYAFSQAMSDFLRTLSFSDPFFRVFNMEVGFEMLGYGLLFESAIRCLPRYRGKSFFPYAAAGGLFLGLSIEIGDSLYTLVVSFLVSVIAVFMACKSFAEAAKREKSVALYGLVAGLALVLPTWLLAPGRVSWMGGSELAQFEDFPNFGFYLLLLRMLAGWIILIGFWSYRLGRRIEDVAPQIGERLRFWGFKVLPSSLCVVVFASYLITSWNGQRARERLENDYLYRSQTAALGMEVGGVDSLNSSKSESQLLAIQRVGSDVRSVYLWTGDANSVTASTFKQDQHVDSIVVELRKSLATNKAFKSGEVFLLGPVESGGLANLNVSSPIVDKKSGEIVYWLGIDLSGATWFRNVSLARLQTIIIAGLVLSLIIFFLYYQIDRESKVDLVLAMERTEAADRAKSEFLAVISHEIRTPLQSVLGYSDLLRSTALNEKQHSCVDSIQSEGKILLRIVQDILDFSNLRKTSFELKNGPVQLRRLIEETFRTIGPMAEKRGLKPALVVSDTVPELVFADGIRLRQVLLNLFGNSVKYTEEGSVTLTANYSKGSQRPLTFLISDTGVGIKQGDLERLFEPFIQLEHSGKFPREGAGLGLAIVSRIIELMGGTIEVKSEVGIGSEFKASFDFNLLNAADYNLEPVRPTESSIAEEARLGKQYPMRILVVDDNPMVRRLIEQYLESLGYEPDLVDGGRLASEKGHEYDLVIMDLRMPDIDGPQAATIIRERTGNPEKPWIVAVSASLQEEEVTRAKEAGVNDFLGKPFFASSLAEKVKAVPAFERFYVDVADTSEGDVIEEEHVPLFVGPATDEVEEITKPEMPTNVFGAAGGFSEDTIQSAIKEVFSMHDEMLEARLDENWNDIREKAHYISNTAMALDIDQLYLDSKDLQKAAEEEAVEMVDKHLSELKLNFDAWNSEE